MQGAGSPPPAAGEATATGLHAHADFAPGTVLAGRFRIEALLGVGGMGVVYRATDQALDVPVALKLLRPELAQRAGAFERFRQELLLARQVSSPHVVRIHDLAQHEGRWLISMDFVDGESLDRRLDRDGAFPVEDALRIARQLAVGLGAAHQRGVIHRDLKPANVLLDGEGNGYIGDFGVARSLATSGLTLSGTVIGTPDYLSPEQARGEPVDARSDLYSLGLILYEMLAGRMPFDGGTMSEILAQRMTRSPQPVHELRPQVPPWVSRLVDRLLRPQPAHRFQDAAAVVAAIDRRQVPPDPLLQRLLARPRRLAAVAAVALLAAAAGGAWWWQAHAPAGAPPPQPLDRLLVLPLEAPADAGLPAPRLAGMGAHLREALAALPGHAVVDRERTLQALRQLDATGGARLDPAALRGLAAAREVLAPGLVARDGRWQLIAQLHLPGAAPQALAGPPAATPGEALQEWIRMPAVAAALELVATPLLALPQDAALDAHGAGLLAQERAQLEPALEHLRAATAAAPGSAVAWLSLAEVAQAIGEQDLAQEALQRGREALGADPPQRLRGRFDAELALAAGEPERAADAWREVLQATPDDSFAELNLARALGAGGDFTAAVAALEALSQRDANDPRIWYELGKFSILSGDARRAVDEYLVRALVLYKRSGHRYGEAETLNALGIGYGRLGQTADAAEQYRRAAELRQAVGNRRGMATSLRNLANVEALTGDFAGAAANLARARSVHESLADREGLAAVDNELGLLAEERGDYPAALESFRRALAGWRELGDTRGLAQALNNIGFADYQLGLYDDAQVYWQQAADTYAQLGSDTGRIRIEQNLGLLATARGDWERARTLLQASLADAQRLQMVEEAAVSHRNLAELDLVQGRIRAALQQARTARELFRQREDQRGQADAGLLEVQALLAAHADGEASAVLEALAPLLEGASAEQRAIARLLRAQLHARAGAAGDAAAALEAAARLAAGSGVRSLQLQIALERARLAGRPDPSLEQDIRALGHAGLRLAWLEWRMRTALARGRPDEALAAWDQARGLLRAHEYLRAHVLLRLAGEAHAAAGDAAAAAAARGDAARALTALRNQVPEPLRPAFDLAEGIAVATAAPSP
ncbi:MAG: protein kinase domain-containing protein [Gammaproteobacteria bacterium]